MRFNFKFILIFFLLAIIACKAEKPGSNESAKAILTVMKSQEDAWNNGDIPGFMQGYVQSDSLRFASGGSITYGWRKTLKRYQKAYSDRQRMGHLTFRVIKIDRLSPQTALVFGHWQLERDKDAPSGLFTLLFRKTPEGWKIFADHTSSSLDN